MLSPHFSSHHRSGVATVAHGDSGGAIHEVRYLLGVMVAGRRKEDGSQLPVRVAGGMELETVVPTLPVLAKGSDAPCHAMPVSPNESADLKHGTVHKANSGIFHE